MVTGNQESRKMHRSRVSSAKAMRGRIARQSNLCENTSISQRVGDNAFHLFSLRDFLIQNPRRRIGTS